MAKKSNRWAVYVRLSPRADDELSLSPQRQERDCRALVKARGGSIASEHVYRDLAVSAFRGGRRPAFDQLMADAEDGAFDYIVFWKLDRFARRLLEFVNINDKLTTYGVQLASVNDPIDTTTPTGRAMLGILAIFAELESDTTRLRVRGVIAQNAAEGRSHGRGHRPFGYTMQDELVDAEADLIREAVDRFLAGESLTAICHDWRDRGVVSTAGNPWIAQTFVNVLRNPRIAGYRRHVRDGDEKLYKATWPAIVDDETFARLSTALVDSRAKIDRRSATKSLLGGILTCPSCGNGMAYNAESPNRGKGRRGAYYRCPTKVRRPGCGRAVMADQTDDHIWALVRYRVLDEGLERAADVAEKQAEHDLQATIAAARQQVENITLDHYVENAMPRDVYLRTAATLREKISDAEDDLARLRSPRSPRGVPTDAAALDRWWKRSTTDQKRALITHWIDRVDVGPVVPERRNRFDTERLIPAWRR